MASRRPTDKIDEDEESTSLDLGRDAPKPARPAPERDASGHGRAPEPGVSKKNLAAPRAPAPSSPVKDPDDTDYLAVRPSAQPSAQSSPAGSAAQVRSPDDDATDFLAERPTGQRQALRAPSLAGGEPEPRARPRTRAVPLDAEALAVVRGAADPPRGPLPRTQPIAEDEEDDVTAPPDKPRRDADEDSAPRSMPRVTRFFVAATPKKRPPTTDPISTPPGIPGHTLDPPRTTHRPLPARADMSAASKGPAHAVTAGANPFARETTVTRSTADGGTSTGGNTAEGGGAAADGVLVIETPDGALVMVDGVERGHGPLVRVTGLDRYARHAIRIQAQGYLRWSGSVSLEGRSAAKVRPSLKRKG